MALDTGPAWLHGLLGDAALLPPSSRPIDRALTDHRTLRTSEYAEMVGPLVIADVKLPDLIDALDDSTAAGSPDETALPITLLVTGGAGAIGPAVRWASRAPSLDLRTIEFALRDEDDLAHNAQRVLTGLDAVEEDLTEVPVYVELPSWDGTPTNGWLRALDELAAGELGVKFRTGGTGLVAGPNDLATCFDLALDRELPFTCTGGSAHALSSPEVTGPGFVNLLAATRVCLEGGDTAGALTETSLASLLDDLDTDTLLRTRRWFAGFASADLLESHEDLVELGLLSGQVAGQP